MSSHLADIALLSGLLEQALALPPDRLDAWMRELPTEHTPLRARLLDMLALRSSPRFAAFLADGPRLEGATAEGGEARAGERVGPYCLIREIGRGGMGTVWLAERVDGALNRQVALKLPRIAWDARLAERMTRERDIAARLEHPNIARLYDAGVDEHGRPYLALEHVDGQPVDAWCRQAALAVPARLRLFLQIARAVAYAHGRLVVHRDLKPSNVLVTPDGQAHLLDFGIARLLQEPSAGDGGQRTQEPDRLLTPHYASPEQLRGETVTVASDVYSLGALLFELLTDRLPHEPADRGLAALQAAVLDEDAPAASSRAADPGTAKALRGELDAILAKALKRDAGARYATADALADDIERHLAGECVLALPDSVGYRLAKTLRRHRIGVAAAAAVLVAVLGGSAAAVVQARRAVAAAERERAVKGFVIDVFKLYEHGRPGSAELRQLPVELLLERGAKLAETKFDGQPQLQAELYGVLGGLFSGVGASEAAARSALRQLETEVALGAGSAQQAQALLLLAQALLAQGRLGDAKTTADQALALAGDDPLLRPRIQLSMAHLLLMQGHQGDAERLLDQALAGLHRPGASSVDRARAQAQRASLLLRERRFDEALPLIEAAIQDAVAGEGALSPTAIDIRLVSATSLAHAGRGDDARRQRETALAMLRASGGAGEVRAALEEADIASDLFATHQIRFEDAKTALERALSLVVARGAQVPAPIRASIELDLARATLAWGDVQRAAALVSSGGGVMRQGPGADRYADLQAIAAMETGRHAEAEAFFAEAFGLHGRMGSDRRPERALDHARRALNFAMQGRFDAAEAVIGAAPVPQTTGHREVLQRASARIRLERGDAAGALALLPAPDADEAIPHPFDHLQLRGEILCALGRHAEGLALAQRSLDLHRDTDYLHSPHVARAQAVAGLCALAAGQRDRAAGLAEQARTSLREQSVASPYFRRPSERLDQLLDQRPSSPSISRPPVSRGIAPLTSRRLESGLGTGVSHATPPGRDS